MSRRNPRSPKQHKREREEEEAVREISPEERRRKFIINFGVGILLVAFLTTSGITCVNLNQFSPQQPQQQQEEGPVDRNASELKRWQEEVAKSPNDSNALANLGYYQLERGLEIYSNDEPNKQKDLDAAMANFEAALKVDPDYGFAQQQKARVLLVQKKLPEAKAGYEAMLASAEKPVPDDAKNKEAAERNKKGDQVQAHLGLAAVAMGQKDVAAALQHMNKAIELDPGNAESYLQRATVHMQMKQKELARKDLETVGEIGKATRNQAMQQFAQQYIYAMENNLLPDPDATPAAPATPGAATPVAPATPATPATP